MSLAADLIADARGYAGSTLTAAINELHSAMTTLEQLGQSIGGSGLPPIPVDPPEPGDPGTPPNYNGPHYEAPINTATAPVFEVVPTFEMPADPGDAPEVAEFEQQAKPQGPAGDTDLLAGIPEVDPADFEVADAPDLLGEIQSITAPVLTTIVVPTAPTYSEPEFLGVRPDSLPSAPTGLDSTMRTNYLTGSAIMRAAVEEQLDSFLDREFPSFRSGMATIEERLATYLAGGSALSPEVEDAMYNRALEKNNAEAARETRRLWGAAARAGFTIPVVTLLKQQKDVSQGRRDNNARAANEILVKQAELEQANLQFAVSASSQLRQVAIQSALAYYSGLVTINGQAIDYARSVVESIVKAYELAVRKAEYQARIYESEARIYEAKLKGALGAIEAYVARVRGLEAQANVDTARVNAYRARIEAVTAEAAVYKAQTEVVAVRAQVERMLVDLYQAKVQAYATQVNARTAEWNGFVAATQGEQARISASAEQVRAFAAQVQAYEAKVRAKTSAVEGAVRTNLAKSQAYATEIEAYRAKVLGASESVRAEVTSYDTTIKAFMAKSAAISDKSKSEIAAYEVQLRGVLAEANILLEQMRMAQALDVSRASGLAGLATTAGQVYSAQAQAALSGMNSLAVQSVSE